MIEPLSNSIRLRGIWGSLLMNDAFLFKEGFHLQRDEFPSSIRVEGLDLAFDFCFNEGLEPLEGYKNLILLGQEIYECEVREVIYKGQNILGTIIGSKSF